MIVEPLECNMPSAVHGIPSFPRREYPPVISGWHCLKSPELSCRCCCPLIPRLALTCSWCPASDRRTSTVQEAFVQHYRLLLVQPPIWSRMTNFPSPSGFVKISNGRSNPNNCKMAAWGIRISRRPLYSIWLCDSLLTSSRNMGSWTDSLHLALRSGNFECGPTRKIHSPLIPPAAKKSAQSLVCLDILSDF